MEKRKAVALFMAFGTKGDVYPIAAIAAAFACDQKQYRVVLITHSAHESLRSHLESGHVTYLPIESPPVLSVYENDDSAGFHELEFLHQKRIITTEHRQECHSAVEGIFGSSPSMKEDFMVINFFALEGWSLAELNRVRCVVAAPYVIPYSAPSSFECHFRKEFPVLYEYLQQASADKVCWKDVIHWMWPLFAENSGLWRSDDLNLSACPLTDPVTGLPTWHNWPPSPLLLYGFSKEIVECPDYWPSNVRVCGFWFLPTEWQFSCKKCGEISAHYSPGSTRTKEEICAAHVKLESFLKSSVLPPVFIGLSSIGSMGFLKHPQAFLWVIQTVMEITDFKFILFTSGYEPLDDAVKVIATKTSSADQGLTYNEEGICLFDGRLFCFPGSPNQYDTIQLAISKMSGCNTSWGQHYMQESLRFVAKLDFPRLTHPLIASLITKCW
ncbi:uncharacterized protein LOC126660906 isoform X3 [Mercurialis annua]|uniref:uncharacterized protein LOC126660906 isoform X3 n=2 Tax=Mercurialis annua TaxID=3986 RepID=UPI00215E4D96|nr:uncharacterized protein LOC126660906 isoform X3 [Mercurialis annua]